MHAVGRSRKFMVCFSIDIMKRREKTTHKLESARLCMHCLAYCSLIELCIVYLAVI